MSVFVHVMSRNTKSVGARWTHVVKVECVSRADKSFSLVSAGFSDAHIGFYSYVVVCSSYSLVLRCRCADMSHSDDEAPDNKRTKTLEGCIPRARPAHLLAAKPIATAVTKQPAVAASASSAEGRIVCVCV